MLLRSFGPLHIIADELAEIINIEAIYLFGSWAARYKGEPGRPPGDIDVLVIGEPDRDELDDAAQRAGRRLGRQVNVTIRSVQWWRSSDDAFHRQGTTRALVQVSERASP